MSQLTGKDIVAIIRAGLESKVAKLKLDQLEIIYHGYADEIALQPPTVITNTPTASSEPAQSSAEQLEELDQYLVNVTDPVAYEKMLLMQR